MDFLNFAEIGALLSVFGIVCLFLVFRVKKRQSWESSSNLKRILLVTAGLLLQLPVLFVIVFKPQYVNNVLDVEPFSFTRLLGIYAVCVVLVAGIWVVNRFVGR